MLEREKKKKSCKIYVAVCLFVILCGSVAVSAKVIESKKSGVIYRFVGSVKNNMTTIEAEGKTYATLSSDDDNYVTVDLEREYINFKGNKQLEMIKYEKNYSNFVDYPRISIPKLKNGNRVKVRIKNGFRNHSEETGTIIYGEYSVH